MMPIKNPAAWRQTGQGRDVSMYQYNNTSAFKNKCVFNTGDVLQAFQRAIQDSGMTPPEKIDPGNITRFSDNGGKNQDGWCSLFINSDGSAGGAYGNWKTVNEKWFYAPNGQPLSFERQQEFSEQIKQAKEKSDQQRKEKQEEAAKKACELWEKSKSADSDHGYLRRKQVQSYGLKQSGNDLLIPVLDGLGVIDSLQTIDPEGNKRFLSDGRVKGGYFALGNHREDDILYICEGYATGATIHSLTNHPVIVAFNSGNLRIVALMFRTMYPNKRIVICADNDLETEKKTGTNPGRKAAEEAAAAISAELCICPVNSDFNDLFCLQGGHAVEQALKKTQKVTEDTWDTPIPLREDAATRLDSALLTGIIGDMARAVSIETETPIELAAGLILSVLGTTCQGKFIVRIKPGYHEPVNIWIVVALDPANRKSSVLIKMAHPLTQFEQIKKIQMEPMIREAESKQQNQEARIKSLRASYGKAEPEDLKKIENEILEIERDLVEIPVCPKVWTQDVTPEHLGTLLNHHNEKMSILSAEGGIFDIIGGRYSNGIANLDLFLQSHSGDPVRVDRGSREPVFLDNPCLTLGLSPQPEVLRGLADKPGFRGKGLLARFLYFLPKSNLGYRGLDSNPVPEAIKAAYQNLIYKLLEIEPGEDEHGKQQPFILNLSDSAYQEWADFYMMVEKELREGGRFEHVTDWAGKLPGAAARLAGLLHCADNPDQPWTRSISLETMNTALELAATFADHALIAFGLMGADRSIEDAQKVWRWIEKNRFEKFTKRDCFNALKSSFCRVSAIEEPLKVLEERNYIQPAIKQTGGRPSVEYSINPEIFKGWL